MNIFERRVGKKRKRERFQCQAPICLVLFLSKVLCRNAKFFGQTQPSHPPRQSPSRRYIDADAATTHARHERMSPTVSRANPRPRLLLHLLFPSAAVRRHCIRLSWRHVAFPKREPESEV